MTNIQLFKVFKNIITNKKEVENILKYNNIKYKKVDNFYILYTEGTSYKLTFNNE
jgi:hypothetical protein